MPSFGGFEQYILLGGFVGVAIVAFAVGLIVIIRRKNK